MQAPKSMFVMIAGVVIAGLVIIMSGRGNWTPDPTDGIAQIAANDTGTFANGLGDNFDEGVKKIRAGDFKTVKEASDWVHARNEATRIEAYKPWYTALNQAKLDGDGKESLTKLADAWEASVPGFRGAIKGK